MGDIKSKAEVRRMCAERDLGVEAKPDSDGICFVGEVGIRSFLLDMLTRRPGDIIEWETGAVLGHHDGAFLFTLGQRRGLDLGGASPLRGFDGRGRKRRLRDCRPRQSRLTRSEERRVGKECRSRWSPYH